ncbi:hypothetical protein ACWFNE_16840 [Cellulomonas sp. NPDC055163]
MSSRPVRWSATVVLVLAVLTAATLVLVEPPGEPPPARDAAVTAGRGTPETAALDAHLREVPGDWPAWTALGALQLERARATHDPGAYAAAERAFARSLDLQPGDNAGALAGRAALAAARHDFAGAEREARLALHAGPGSPDALAALTDALTELGRYDEALAVARQLDAARPGVASFTRLSYQAELRGDVARARALMADAAAGAGTPAQAAFARTHEGLLALGDDDVAGADVAWRAGTAVAPRDPDLVALGAQVAWAQGDRALAVRRWAEAVELRPTAAHLAGHAEALAATGSEDEAERVLELARAARQLAAGSGVAADADDVLFEAEHGDPASAARAGRDLHARAPSVTAADACAWALHRAGRDAEALVLADQALALGWRHPTALAHRGIVRAALGLDASADLRAALHGEWLLPPSLAAQVRAQLGTVES